MWNRYSGENCSDDSVNNQPLQQNSTAATRRTAADNGIQLWDQRIRYTTERATLTTPIQAGQTWYGQARIDPQEPQSMQYSDGPESLSVFQQGESTDAAVPRHSRGDYLEYAPSYSYNSRSMQSAGHLGAVLPDGGERNTPGNHGVQDDKGCGFYTESVSGESSYAMNGQPNNRLRAISADITIQPFESQTFDYEQQGYEPYSNSNPSGANSYLTSEDSPSIAIASPESSISSVESDIKLGGSAKDFASPIAEQLEDYREKKSLCRESFKEAGIDDEDVIELSKKLLYFLNVTNKVKCLSCKIEVDMSWEIIHKPGCLTNIIQGDEDYPSISVGPQRSTAEAGNGYLPQLSDSDVSMESLRSERNGSPDEFREESTPYKAPYKENTCGFASQLDNSLSGELILSGNNTTTSTNGSQFQIKEPPIHFINSNIHEETHSTYGDTCSHSDWSSLYVCQYCKVNEVGVTTKPCGHNICGVCFQPQLQKLCAKEATLCRCCKWLITGFNTFFPRCS